MDGSTLWKYTGHRLDGTTATSPTSPLRPNILSTTMNAQRPLVPDSSASASSHGETDHSPSSAAPNLAQRKKKPGPKRDSKPAPSEKLERNRQAQRTHRERKEQYTKDLEVEVMRLKELYAAAVRERDGALEARDRALHDRDSARVENQHLQEENQRMRVFIQASNSSNDSGYDGTRNNSVSMADDVPNVVTHTSVDAKNHSAWELSETRGFASEGALQPQSPVLKVETESSAKRSKSSSQLTAQPIPVSIDYDELGLDFVLTLERPCFSHGQFLHVRAHNYQASANGEMGGQPLEVPDDGENQHISGHALMATAPPLSHIMNDPASRYPTQFPMDLKREDLIRLLDLSSQLAINEQELPPVKAWLKIMRDGRLGLFSVNDLALLKQTLLAKVRCYRFGAVIAANDIELALVHVLDSKNSSGTIAASSATRNACIMPTSIPS